VAQSPLGSGPYAPPGSSGDRPLVIVLYRVYAATLFALYVAAAVFFEVFARAPSTALEHAGMLGLTLGLAVFYGVAAFVPFRPWGWTLALVAICFGLTSCMLPVATGLLLYWMRPLTKAAFRRL
jgi:hypothetical protein